MKIKSYDTAQGTSSEAPISTRWLLLETSNSLICKPNRTFCKHIAIITWVLRQINTWKNLPHADRKLFSSRRNLKNVAQDPTNSPLLCYFKHLPPDPHIKRCWKEKAFVADQLKIMVIICWFIMHINVTHETVSLGTMLRFCLVMTKSQIQS